MNRIGKTYGRNIEGNMADFEIGTGISAVKDTGVDLQES